MREIFDYINNNSFLATILGVILGWLLNNNSNIKERKERQKEELAKEKRRQYENKAELRIVKTLEKSNNIPDIEVFLAPFKVKYIDGYKKYEIIYPENITNKKLHKYKEFHLKNIGNSDINELDICATFKEHNILVDYENLDTIVKNKFVEYDCCYDRKILKEEKIIIRVYYLDGYQIFHPLSCTLALLFRDGYNNLWEQPFWYEKNNLYEPRHVSHEEYRSYVTSDDALDYFDKPWKW